MSSEYFAIQTFKKILKQASCSTAYFKSEIEFNLMYIFQNYNFKIISNAYFALIYQ